MLYAAILAITIVMLMMAINMNTIAKRIVYLEREHMHLAEGTGEAIKSIQESTDGVVQSAERVIASGGGSSEGSRDGSRRATSRAQKERRSKRSASMIRKK